MTDAAATPSTESTVQSADSIAKDIAAAIAEHRLPPGSRLREEALARVYDVSRTKVRAALLMLSKDRLIDIVPDKGAFVAKPSAEEARNVFAVRRALEAEMVRELIQKATPADYRRLKAHLVGERRRCNRTTRRRARACWATFTSYWPKSPAIPSCSTSSRTWWRAAR